MTALRRLNEVICATTLWLSAIAVALIAVVVLAQVFCRYVLNNSLSWAEDVSLMLMVSSAFLVMPYALREGQHIAVEIILEALPARLRALVSLLIDLAIFVLTTYAIWVSWRFAISTTMMASSVPIRMSLVYAIMPLSFALTLPGTLETILRRLLGESGNQSEAV